MNYKMKAIAFKLVLRSWWRNKTFSIISIVSLAIRSEERRVGKEC